VSRAALLIETLGLALALFSVVRLFLSWRVTPHAASHHISIAGQSVSYPAANVDAVAVLLLSVAGLWVLGVLLRGTAREVIAARRLGRNIHLEPSPHPTGALVVRDERPLAFCTGLIRPRIYVSSGALAMLDEAAVAAVVAHESEHARRRDPLRLATGRVLGQALFFVPGLGELGRRQQSLAELGADESAAAESTERRSALARAMLAFIDSQGSASAVGVDPERIDALVGEPGSWRFPSVLCLAATGVIILLSAIAVLVGQLAEGSATLAPPFLSRQPCILVLAFIPALVGVISARILRSSRRRARS
jgi:beta-lactamase regulating signal transducer with metallopeptidase domain